MYLMHILRLLQPIGDQKGRRHDDASVVPESVCTDVWCRSRKTVPLAHESYSVSN
jgi:hypothetical protein